MAKKLLSDGPNADWKPADVQRARQIIFEHHTSQMQAYVSRGLTFFGALLSLVALISGSAVIPQLKPVLSVVTMVIGFLIGCITFCVARFVFYGQVVGACTTAPVLPWANWNPPPQALVDLVARSISNGALYSVEEEPRSGDWLHKLWAVAFFLGADTGDLLVFCSCISALAVLILWSSAPLLTRI